jgi:hypothetical protein
MHKSIHTPPLRRASSIKISAEPGSNSGYMMVILVFAVTVLTIGLMVAVPVWQTQMQREKEEELIFRGNQYVEAIRLYQQKNPGVFPDRLQDLLEEKCIRRLYEDPMTEAGEWNVVLFYQESSSVGKVMVASQRDLRSLDHPQIIGVVSQSNKKSKKIYNRQETYDRWLFFYGQESDTMPEIVYFNRRKQ